MKGLTHLMIERLHPDQIKAAIDTKPIVYLPLGAIEWHGLHLPIGLDGLTAHHLCLKAAQKCGGLVLPPLYYGMTGSIGHHPWTILVEEEKTLMSLLRNTLDRLEDFGVELAVVFTGHFGRRQLALLDELAQIWAGEDHKMQILVRPINACPEAGMEGDHGAIFETSLLAQMHPELVDIGKLPAQSSHPANDPNDNSWGDHRRDPENVLFGILGDDPRDYDDDQAKALLDTILTWLVCEVNAFDHGSQVKATHTR